MSQSVDVAFVSKYKGRKKSKKRRKKKGTTILTKKVY